MLNKENIQIGIYFIYSQLLPAPGILGVKFYEYIYITEGSMPSFYTIFSLFMIFSDIEWEEIINDLEMFDLMVFSAVSVILMLWGDSCLGR